jgi:aspartate aminotransferase
MTERVRRARAEGRPIIGLSSGDPNITTDERIVAAAMRAVERGETHYSSPAGQPELRAAIAQREAARCGVRYDVEEILVTPGGKFALLAALMGVVENGDEVLVPEPGWVSYHPCVRLCGGVPVPLAMLDTIDPERIERAVGARTRAIILNSPANPTGRVLSAMEIDAVLDVAERHGLWLLFDQVYADLCYRGPMSFPQARARGRSRTLVIDSFSKTFGMTGWRLGYLAAPAALITPIQRFIQHSIYCVPAFVQAAGVAALGLFDELAPRYRATFQRRMSRAVARLSAIDGIECRASDATFYLFPKIAGSDIETAKHWLDTIDVAVMPGSAFGERGSGHLRLSLTCPEGELDDALGRIAKAGLKGIP